VIEEWGEGIHLLSQWGFFDRPEPRMKPYRWIAPLFRLLKPICVFHFQLGEVAGLNASRFERSSYFH
jgi:hypothetical protein